MESRWFTKNKDTIVSHPYFFDFSTDRAPNRSFYLKPKNKPCIGPVYDFAMMRQFELHCPESIRWFPAKRSVFWRRTVL